MSQRISATDSDASALPTRDNPGISLVPLGSNSQLSDTAPAVRDVGPRFTEWLPAVLDELLPVISRTVRELAFQHDPRVLRDEIPRQFPHECLYRKHGVGTAPDANTPAHPFTDAVAKYAISYGRVLTDELSPPQQERYEWARRVVTGAGTHEYPGAPTGLDALRATIVPLLDASDYTPSIVLSLSESAWLDVDDCDTAGRALEAIEVLAEVIDVRLVFSPMLNDYLEQSHPDFFDEYLTGTEDDTTNGGHYEADESALWSAYNIVGGFAPGGGRLRLLAALEPDSEREQRDLRADAEIDLSDGAIDRYVRELADEHGLLAIDDRPKYNRISLTETGSAAQTLIGPKCNVFHPEQSRFDSGLTRTPHRSTSIVCCPDGQDSPTPAAGEGGGGGSSAAVADNQSTPRSSRSLPATAPTAEDWLAETGEAATDGYTQWLDGPTGRLDAWEMHERLLAGRRIEGVTFVDDAIEPFGDGEVTYISCFDDVAQVVAQWGGPLPTLVRFTSALLSEKMWSKILTPSAIGDDLDELYGGALDDATKDVLRLGAQLGWIGEDEQDYDGLRERYRQIRDLLLSKLGEVRGGDSTEWGDLCKDAHGLLASATHLYQAIDVDLTLHIRVPNTGKLRAGEDRYGGFLDFFKHTVPKNAAYGVHSVYRLLYEERVDKLKHRLGYEFGDDPSADLTASWVVSGPTATTFREDVEQAIASKANDIRESIQEGIERGVNLQIPVVGGNGYPALRRVVERHAARKGFDATGDRDFRRIVRLSTATLGTEPGRCSPFALAEALLAMAKARSSGAGLEPTDVAHGLAQLPAERLLPSLPATMRKALKALLVADEPLGRSEIINRAGISGSSYDRNIDELAALDLVESVGNGGHRKWLAWIVPWWSPLADVDRPRTADDDDDRTAFPASRWDDVLYQVALDLDLDPEYDLFATPVDIEDVCNALPRLDRWRGFILGHYGVDPSDETPDQVRYSPDTPLKPGHAAEIGSPPAGWDSEQASLSAGD